VTERFRYPISSHVTGAFYPFAVRRDCPGASWVLAIRFPVGGESYVVRATVSNSPKSHVLSSRVYVRALRMLSHLFNGLSALGKSPPYELQEHNNNYIKRGMGCL
jgi:hypothetical protein